MRMRGSGVFSTSLQAVLATFLVLSCGRSVQLSSNLKETALSPDIVVTFASQAEVVDGQIRFQLTFKNIGSDMDGDARMYSKAFLVPHEDLSKKLVGQGLVLASFYHVLNLASDEEKTVSVIRDLPSMAAGQYFLGVTINSRAAVLKEGHYVYETVEAQKNNVTEQMQDLGRLPAYKGPKESGKYDLYHEVANARINLNGNTAMHVSRNVLRVMSGKNEVPDRSYWDGEISARFLYFKPSDGKAFVGSYTNEALDKVWGGISWRDEMDAKGRKLHVDYYSNAPAIDHLEQGKYMLGVLMNVTDAFTLDSYPSNNLDLTSLDLTARSLLGLPKESFFNVESFNDDEHPFEISAAVLGGEEGFEWSYEIGSQSKWLNVSAEVENGILKLYFTASRKIPEGTFSIPVTIWAMKGDRVITETTNLMISYQGRPVPQCPDTEYLIEPTDSSVRLWDKDGIRWMSLKLALKNIGSKDLNYSAQSIYELEIPQSRVIAPNKQHTIKVLVPLVGVPITNDSEAEVAISYETNVGEFTCNYAYNPRKMLEYKIK